MSTYNLRRFAQPDVLKTIKPESLIAFFKPHESYFSERNFTFVINGSGELEYELLAAILMDATEKTPTVMIDALYCIQEMSNDNQFDNLQDLAKGANLTFANDCTPADLAIAIWLHDQELLKRSHAEVLVFNPKTFKYFQAKKKSKNKLLKPTAEQCKSIEKDMDLWFMQNNRGSGSRLFAFPVEEENKTYFLIRHGMPLRREGKIEEGKSGSIVYRPEFHDVVIYDNENHELAIFNKSDGKKERNMYLGLFGGHFFKDADHFPNDDKYTLAPLIDKGADALACVDIPGMEYVKLTEIQLQFRGPLNDRRIYRSKDFFKSLENGKRVFPNYGELVSASFSVKFEESKPRTVKIQTPNVAKFDRKEDSHLIETWLRKRGFVIEQETDEEHEHTATAHHAIEAAMA